MEEGRKEEYGSLELFIIIVGLVALKFEVAHVDERVFENVPDF